MQKVVEKSEKKAVAKEAKETEVAEALLEGAKKQPSTAEAAPAKIAIVEENGEGLLPESKLPFPRATVVNLLRKNLSGSKQIKGQVKDELNLWLGKMVERVAEKMNAQPYTFANYDMLKEAIAPYEHIEEIDRERKSYLEHMNRIKADCDALITEIDEASKKKVKSLAFDEEKLPLPKATLTRKLRKHLDKGKQIKGPVKKGLNIFLGKMVGRVGKKLNESKYSYIDGGMFHEAIETFESVSEIEKEKERIIKQLESIKVACDILISEVERKFRV